MFPNNKIEYAVLGLGYGDEGKGHIVDWLARKTHIGSVVRYGGGPQAAHNVVDPNGTHHCFSQFGSGSLVGCNTILCDDMVVNPISLEVEADVLSRKIGSNPYRIVSASPNLTIVTPYHRVLGQMLELSRKNKRHSSCGMGVGQAIKWRQLGGIYNLTVGDFHKSDSSVSDKIRYGLNEAKSLAYKLVVVENTDSLQVCSLWDRLLHPGYGEKVEEVLRRCVDLLELSSGLKEETQYIFEGSQGVLLDCEHGFFPNITKSRIRFPDRNGVFRIGVIRSYQTRHGNGLFVTEDPCLESVFDEEHNVENQWQGKMRRGWLDLLSVRYAIKVAGGVDALAVTHMDYISRVSKLKICNRYLYNGVVDDFLKDNFVFDISGSCISITDIIVKERSESSRLKLVSYLCACTPQYDEIDSDEDLISTVERNTGVKILLISNGPTHRDVYLV